MPATMVPADQLEPPPPFIGVEGVHNFRDIGGYAISTPGHSVKSGIFYRSGRTSRITDRGIQTLTRLGISAYYDLRSEKEIAFFEAKGRGGVAQWPGCRRVHVPVFHDGDAAHDAGVVRNVELSAERPSDSADLDGVQKEAAEEIPALEASLQVVFGHLADVSSGGVEGYMRAYRDMLNHGAPAYRKILLHLATQPDRPIAVNCTSGKDRTGIISALLLSLCGVADGTIASEYHLTEQWQSEEFKRGTISRLMENPALRDNEAGARNMLGAKREVMLAFLVMLRDEFGGPKDYMVNVCGLTEAQVASIKAYMIVDAPAIYPDDSL